MDWEDIVILFISFFVVVALAMTAYFLQTSKCATECAPCDLCSEEPRHDGGTTCREKRMEYHATIGGYDICYIRSPLTVKTFASQ